jgi:hypothetical protein
MKRMFVVVFWVFAVTIAASAQTTFYFPHLADGTLGSTYWRTTIFLTNNGTAPASGTITFTRDNSTIGLAGSAFAITFKDESNVVTTGTIVFSIAPGQTKKYASAGNASTYAGGFAAVSTTTGTATGTSIFSEFISGSDQLVGEAGVPQASALTKQAIFVDTQLGFHTGVAYSNPGTAAATVTLSLLASDSTLVATTNQTLGPGNHASVFTTDVFPSAPQLAGTMQISSSSPVASIALRFDPSFALFTTIPPVSIASVFNPAVQWLQERPWLSPLTSIARLLGAFQMRI